MGADRRRRPLSAPLAGQPSGLERGGVPTANSYSARPGTGARRRRALSAHTHAHTTTRKHAG
eukprot:5410574-Alexandrium_andersonii.AAC.1